MKEGDCGRKYPVSLIHYKSQPSARGSRPELSLMCLSTLKVSMSCSVDTCCLQVTKLIAGIAQSVERLPGRRSRALPMVVCKYVDENGSAVNADCQEVSRCHTKGESEKSIVHHQKSTQVRDSPWPWNPGEMSPEVRNRGINGAQKGLMSSKKFEKI